MSFNRRTTPNKRLGLEEEIRQDFLKTSSAHLEQAKSMRDVGSTWRVSDFRDVYLGTVSIAGDDPKTALAMAKVKFNQVGLMVEKRYG